MPTGFTGGLQWLKESFEEAAQDIDNDPNTEDVDGVPLVPVGEDADSAMDRPIFQRLLQALGIVPPFDEQVILANNHRDFEKLIILNLSVSFSMLFKCIFFCV